ncbi:MAG TPA: hypothetical protein VFH54_20210 [Mycobacteriales bacterium]|nr:hypothetical protein [Mycobacteriales bacterium]
MTTTNRLLPRTFVATLVVSSCGVFLQAVTAGVFVNQDGRDSWVSVHGVIADVTWASALVAAVIGLARVRRSRPSLAYGAIALFVLALVQTGIGHLITDKGMDGLIVVHVPLAVVLFGLATWLLIGLARAHRALPDVIDPYVDEAAEPLMLANRR